MDSMKPLAEFGTAGKYCQLVINPGKLSKDYWKLAEKKIYCKYKIRSPKIK